MPSQHNGRLASKKFTLLGNRGFYSKGAVREKKRNWESVNLLLPPFCWQVPGEAGLRISN
jgi:hypothetical protein